MVGLSLEPLATFRVRLDPMLRLGDTPRGDRRIVPIVGGTVEGARLRGEILPGGADWQLVHADGTASIDTRSTVRTHDGALLYLRTEGVRHGPPEVLERLAAGEDVDPATYYFRLFVHFETSAPAYAWLGRTLTVATARRDPSAVVYEAATLA
ncbi:DUF3237 domain-containing protein [Actinomadura flavalba]|uniref:DUF3237 domain-containing protein n=1 Tax=Actinomadura flavalba TaxID=1120938 RepID=UPI00036D4C1B|nr:DUF3237 domain-containing protein [Actinomadura flavalba]